MKLVFVQQQLLCILSPKSDTNQFAKTISLRFSKHYLKWNTRHIWCNFRRLVMRYQEFTADLALFKKKWHTLKYNIWHFITGQYEFIPNNIEASFFFFCHCEHFSEKEQLYRLLFLHCFKRLHSSLAQLHIWFKEWQQKSTLSTAQLTDRTTYVTWCSSASNRLLVSWGLSKRNEKKIYFKLKPGK
jgi:hypothetical protein